MRLSRILLWTLLIVGAAALLIVAALFFSPSRLLIPAQLLECTLYALLWVAVALGCAVVMERGRAVPFMISGLAACAVTLALSIGAVFLGDYNTWSVWLMFIVWPAAWAFLMLLIGVLMLPRSRGGWWRMLRRSAIVLLAVLAAHICFAVTYHELFLSGASHLLVRPVSLVAIGSLLIVLVLSIRRGARFAARWTVAWLILLLMAPFGLSLTFGTGWSSPYLHDWSRALAYEEAVYRIGTALALLAGGAFAGTFLTLWLPALAGRGELRGPVAEFALRCPRCGEEQTGRTGGCTCRRCGLSIRVELV